MFGKQSKRAILQRKISEGLEKVREEKDKEKAAKKESRTRKSAQKAVVITPIPVSSIRPRVRFQLEETPGRLLRSATSIIPRPNYYLPPLAEVIEDDSDAESFTTALSADSSEDGYCPHTTTSPPGPEKTSSTPVALLTMRLRSRK
ncbi:hypothetical protein K440DRAFT_642605 [Wilcoxina mikolae CBS 423.85]|nr:hypothetical protein K440DRAFT_642605 [Wilcoxina mikolae CBS 423.85]